MYEHACVHWLYLGGGRRLALGLEFLEVGVDLGEFRLVESSIVAFAFENRDDALARRLGTEAGHRGNRAIDASSTGLDGGEVHRCGHAARHVRVNLDGHFGKRLHERAYELTRRAGREDAGHIFNRE